MFHRSPTLAGKNREEMHRDKGGHYAGIFTGVFCIFSWG
jgi:hypothetical protein